MLSKSTVTYGDQDHSLEHFTPNNMYYVSWYKGGHNLTPGSSQDNLILENASLPGIVNYYVQGYTEPVRFRREEDEDEIPEEISDDYKNSVNGKTLGPVDPPSPFVPVTFTETIIGYVTESGTLGWISDPAVVTSITANLNTAKGKIGSDNPGAIATLDALLTDLETQHGTSVNDEAYFLIKYNALYLKERL